MLHETVLSWNEVNEEQSLASYRKTKEEAKEAYDATCEEIEKLETKHDDLARLTGPVSANLDSVLRYHKI
ncbi:hypothetical protein ACOMHN_062112 [Nucella lapillus]